MFKPKPWLHVNHPKSKARIHLENGCPSIRRAVARIRRGLAYGPVRGDENGYWDGPFASLHDAEAAQRLTKRRIQDKCRICFRADFESDLKNDVGGIGKWSESAVREDS